MVNVFPLMSETYGVAEERFAVWQTAAVRAMLATSLLFAACCLALGDEIVRSLYDGDFDPAATVLRIFGVNVVFLSLIGVFWRSLVARGRQGVNLQLQAISVALRLASGIGLIAPLAAVGAAISSGISALVHAVLLIRATTRSGAPEAILRVGWRFALAAAASGTTMWLLAGSIPLPMALIAGSLEYGALSLLLGAVTPDDRRLAEPLARRFSRRA